MIKGWVLVGLVLAFLSLFGSFALAEGNSSCIDTDGGRNYFVKGTLLNVYLSTGLNPVDYCVTYSDKTLVEYSCSFTNSYGDVISPYSESYECPNGCSDGRCVKAGETCTPGYQCYNNNSRAYRSSNCTWSGFENCPLNYTCSGGVCVPPTTPPVTPSCKDSDGGLNYDGKGTTTNGVVNKTDYCTTESNITNLIEFYCVGNSVSSQPFKCSYGCRDGACILAPRPPPPPVIPSCKDTDWGINYDTFGQIYKDGLLVYSDNCLNSTKGTLMEYYCKSNSTANYVFYDCPNGCFEGECVSSSDSGNGTSSGDSDSCLNDPNNYWDQQTDKCFSGFNSDKIKSLCSDPDGGINKYLGAHTFGFRSVYADSKDKRIRTGGKDGCVNYNQLIEHYCDDNGFIQVTYIDCPNGCSGDRCIKGPEINETVICYFENSNETERCYTAEDNSRATCSGVGSCTTGISGEKGEKVTWKSSCGGYQYTVMDGDNEKVIFNCNAGQINATIVAETWFRNAYWKCYDGKEFNEGGETSCKPYGLWKKYATEACNAKCSSGKSKCGVDSFSMTNSCYPDLDKPITETSNATARDCEEYKKECKFGNGVLCEKWKKNCQAEGATSPSTDTSVTICKDSCSLDGKCYPFGYRKSGKFCSDNGAFVSQLKADSSCDNGFECSSNICVSNKCVSQGLLEKILNWFKNLFG